MIRAVMKGSLLFAFGRMPGGPKLYRTLTRSAMGTQATHVDKLARVWPGYVRVWKERCGFEFEGATVGILEGGWTPLPFLMSYLLSGKGGWVVNHEARIHQRYAKHALESAATLEFEGVSVPESRRKVVRTLLDANGTTGEILRSIQGELHEGGPRTLLPVESGSTDLLHSGGVLEHFRPEELREVVQEFFRVLRPAGLCSHVFDHRDHLYHADKRYPFLNHLRYSERLHGFAFGHPLLYHSRMLPSQVLRVFQDAGFEPVMMRRLILPQSKYVEADAETADGILGLKRSALAPKFHAATDADLYTAAAHYVFKKRD